MVAPSIRPADAFKVAAERRVSDDQIADRSLVQRSDSSDGFSPSRDGFHPPPNGIVSLRLKHRGDQPT
jgi:hypothetical protein